jgi:glycosyltransferase involved in cell wall biosynthesis
LGRPILWTYTPFTVDVFDRKRFAALVYHCVDDLAAYPGIDERAFRDAETALLRHADVAIAASRPLERHLRRAGARDVRYWPNPADTEELMGCALNGIRRDRPVAGFVGALAEHKVDAKLIREVAEKLPQWRFELVGPTGLGLAGSTFSRERFPQNVTIMPPVKAQDLSQTLARFTVGIIPYARNSYTASVFPLKVFEYLAAGLPVVSTPLPSLVGEVQHVAFADGSTDFANALSQASRSTPRERQLAVDYARTFSWNRRTDEALGLLRHLAAK